MGGTCGDKAPHLIAEWHPTLNGEYTPFDVSAGSDFKPWWQCAAGHEWRAAVHSRVRGYGCDQCARIGQWKSTREESLAATHPALAAQMHPNLNQGFTAWDIKPGSRKKVWWICDQGHVWCAPPWRRTVAGAGCLQCSRAVKPGDSIIDRRPELLEEWDQEANGDLTPDKVSYGSGILCGWKCQTCGYRWITTAASRCGPMRNGCIECRNKKMALDRQKPKPGKSFTDRLPELLPEWDQEANGEIAPDQVSYSSNKPRHWKCVVGHTWSAPPSARARGYGCPQCALSRTSIEEIRLRAELIAAGIPVDTDGTVSIPGRTRKYHCDIVCSDWKLIVEFDSERFHRGKASIARDTTKTNALTDAGWTVIRLRDGLAALFDNDIELPRLQSPLVRAQSVLRKAFQLGFHATNYAEYLRATEPWGTAAANEAIRRELDRSVASEFPDTAAEWHPTRNGALTPDCVRPGTHDKHWWLCRQCGNEWLAEVRSRTYGGTGCEPCAKKKAGRTLSTPKPGRSAADKAPHLLTEWLDRNSQTLWEVRPGTHVRMWWRCNACQHQWQAPVSSRVRGVGCPPCGEKAVGLQNRRPKPGRSLLENSETLTAEWDQEANGDITPADVSYGSRLEYWWKCMTCGEHWKETVASRAGSGRAHCDRKKRTHTKRTAPA